MFENDCIEMTLFDLDSKCLSYKKHETVTQLKLLKCIFCEMQALFRN